MALDGSDGWVTDPAATERGAYFKDSSYDDSPTDMETMCRQLRQVRREAVQRLPGARLLLVCDANVELSPDLVSTRATRSRGREL
eukprot:7632007-Pyramimonas_sp.AAC.1